MELKEKQKQILLEISEFCERECAERECCVEEECVLYRIEQIVVGETENE